MPEEMRKEYLMIFGHSPYGAHQFHFKANNASEAKAKAIARLEKSCMNSLTYEVFEISTTVVDYSTWKRVQP